MHVLVHVQGSPGPTLRTSSERLALQAPTYLPDQRYYLQPSEQLNTSPGANERERFGALCLLRTGLEPIVNKTKTQYCRLGGLHALQVMAEMTLGVAPLMLIGTSAANKA
jgi:hypothetical protein